MEKVMKYKGVVLWMNTAAGRLSGEGAYVVLLTNGSRIAFKSMKDFKDAVNGINPYAPVPYGITRIDTNNDWKDACLVEDFREYALENQFSDGMHFKAPEEGDFYSVYEEDGKKYVNLCGWLDNDFGWRITEVSANDIPLEEFIKNFAKDEWDYVQENLYVHARQYGPDEISRREALDTCNHFWSGTGPNARLHFSELTMDTPCGHYIC